MNQSVLLNVHVLQGETTIFFGNDICEQIEAFESRYRLTPEILAFVACSLSTAQCLASPTPIPHPPPSLIPHLCTFVGMVDVVKVM